MVQVHPSASLYGDIAQLVERWTHMGSVHGFEPRCPRFSLQEGWPSGYKASVLKTDGAAMHPRVRIPSPPPFRHVAQRSRAPRYPLGGRGFESCHASSSSLYRYTLMHTARSLRHCGSYLFRYNSPMKTSTALLAAIPSLAILAAILAAVFLSR